MDRKIIFSVYALEAALDREFVKIEGIYDNKIADINFKYNIACLEDITGVYLEDTKHLDIMDVKMEGLQEIKNFIKSIFQAVWNFLKNIKDKIEKKIKTLLIEANRKAIKKSIAKHGSKRLENRVTILSIESYNKRVDEIIGTEGFEFTYEFHPADFELLTLDLQDALEQTVALINNFGNVNDVLKKRAEMLASKTISKSSEDEEILKSDIKKLSQISKMQVDIALYNMKEINLGAKSWHYSGRSI
jgi:hypothetical protein